MSYGFLQWFNKTKELITDEGMKIDIWTFNHKNNKQLLSEWAKHFREMYSDDKLLDKQRKGTGLSRSEYLLKRVFENIRNLFVPKEAVSHPIVEFSDLLHAPKTVIH